MRQLIAGNWKMNGLLDGACALAEAIAQAAPGLGCDLLLCPPFTLLAPLAGRLKGGAVQLGAQDCHPQACGAHTGDIAAEMLADLGCQAVILGHSERRQNHGETNALVRAKAEAAMRAGLQPVICVGETEAERDGGRHMAVVAAQVAESVPDGFAGTIAYEPVWAIGTGRTPGEGDVEAMHRDIREALLRRLGEAGRAPRILYGGSVKAGNAAGLLRIPEVGGALVGGASLDAGQFLAIAGSAA